MPHPTHIWAASRPAYDATVEMIRRLHDLPGSRFSPDEPVVALTFDDGPGASTPAISETLERLEVPSTFFVVGEAAAEDPEQVTALAEAGHTVGGHSWTHTGGDEMDDDQIVDESVRTSALITELTGDPALLVRPPFRKTDAPRYAQLLEGRGFTAVTWSIDPRDWESSDPVAVTRRVLDNLHCGAIVVLHDGGGDRSVTLEALPLIVHGARLAGYRFAAL